MSAIKIKWHTFHINIITHRTRTRNKFQSDHRYLLSYEHNMCVCVYYNTDMHWVYVLVIMMIPLLYSYSSTPLYTDPKKVKI